MINQQLSPRRQTLQCMEWVLNLTFLLLLVAATDSAGVPDKMSRRNRSGTAILVSIACNVANALAGDLSAASMAPDIVPCSIALLLRVLRPSILNQEIES